jgi:hypothetical protein
MQALIRSLKNATELEHLQLKHVKQFNECMEDLYESFKDHKKIKSLQISDNSLSDY